MKVNKRRPQKRWPYNEEGTRMQPNNEHRGGSPYGKPLQSEGAVEKTDAPPRQKDVSEEPQPGRTDT